MKKLSLLFIILAIFSSCYNTQLDQVFVPLTNERGNLDIRFTISTPTATSYYGLGGVNNGGVFPYGKTYIAKFETCLERASVYTSTSGTGTIELYFNGQLVSPSTGSLDIATTGYHEANYKYNIAKGVSIAAYTSVGSAAVADLTIYLGQCD